MMERNRYADLLRVGAIYTVVLGHWLLTDVTYRNGHVSGQDALHQVAWGRWLTLLFQVMPIVFLVGGYANTISWTTHHRRGEDWTSWVRRRAPAAAVADHGVRRRSPARRRRGPGGRRKRG
ncbi:hypothetical protein TR51_10375 [Kitasatospora griseola]|uniref:Acyltransferase 3 domain-containing protein n=1 Tax=Kitasatospora griseola TaxID=2064 RepID=A0A0D0PW83_KITGR|nr:hypothetical protein [Kitasatospora griseola]KIQ64632.1 hypothetical protein TR51_10375 [Kitasatospora griseola]